MLSRRDTWLSDLFRRGGEQTNLRVKEGEAARWAGSVPLQAASQIACAPEVVRRGTQIFMQGGCDAPSAMAQLSHHMARAELGTPFVLSANDFPLSLQISSANASLRGEDAYEASADPTQMPSLFASFYTEELDWTNRYLLWIGVPVGYLLLSICSCCTCCLCACICCYDESNKQPRMGRLEAHELADLAEAMGDSGGVDGGMPDLPDEEEALDPRYHRRRAGDDDITPA